MPLSLDFAFEGFRILKARPRLVAWWGVITLIGGGLAQALAIVLSGPAIERARQIVSNPQPGPDPDVSQAVLLRLLPGFLAWQGVSIVTTAIIAAAVCRAVAGDGDKDLGGLRFGARELQLILVMAVNAVLTYGVPLALMGAAMATNDIALFGLSMVSAIAALWLSFRLSLNVPQSFSERRIALFDSFTLTREGGWPLLGGYVLTLILFGVVYMLGSQVVAGAVVAAFGSVTAISRAPDMTSLQAYMQPENLVVDGLALGLLSPQLMAITLAAPVAAYRRLSGLDRAEGVRQVS